MQPRNPNEYDMLAKIFVDGEHFVGKTSTALRYCTEEWNPNALCTIGTCTIIKVWISESKTSLWMAKGSNFKYGIWLEDRGLEPYQMFTTEDAMGYYW